VRVFHDFIEAKGELARDLQELGTNVFAGYQSKDVDKMDEAAVAALTTKELTNYGYVVLSPQRRDLHPSQPWAGLEWRDRLEGILGSPSNPGHAWQERREIWEPLREADGGFSYTYSERFFMARTRHVIEELKAHPTTRQAYISIWNPQIDTPRLGKRRVPCSLGYQVMIRDDMVHLTYHMRSSDFATHFDNDVWLALSFQEWVAANTTQATGSFTHVLGSLHVYAKEVANVF
jgi:thymidylate synthase